MPETGGPVRQTDGYQAKAVRGPVSSVRRIGRADELKQTVYPSDAYTAVKHTVYRRYAQCWMAKILQKFPQGATIVDAFSGAGVYSDGLDGSPIVFAKTFLEHSAL